MNKKLTLYYFLKIAKKKKNKLWSTDDMLTTFNYY